MPLEITQITDAAVDFCQQTADLPVADYVTAVAQLDRSGLARYLVELDRVRDRLLELADLATGALDDHLSPAEKRPYEDALAGIHHAGDLTFNTVRDLDAHVAEALL